jgi:hypothetical protein
MTLEEALTLLSIYGAPSICQFAHDNKWYCCVRTTTKGYDLTFKSDTNCDTPLEAALRCLERARDALPQLLMAHDRQKADDIPF